ncbi:MAG: sporulation protein YqfC [Clostridia bacterium]|nr:sporulation protein YqfC [Clostridia bacterium]
MSLNFKSKREQLKEAFSKMLEMPSDVILDMPKIILIGNIQMYIENHRGIVSFSPEKITIAVSLGQVEITGTNLIIRGIFSDEILLEGTIESVQIIR